MDPHPGGWKDRARRELLEARHRLLALLGPLPDEALCVQHSELMSPLSWDVAHVANHEELWLVRALGGERLAGAGVDALYDPRRHPRSTRAGLPLLTSRAAFEYAARVRERALALLERVPEDSPDPLLREGFVYGMVAQHEQQHAETVLATLQLMERFSYPPPGEAAPAHAPAWTGPREVQVPEGTFVMGTGAAWALDNERPAHEVWLGSFTIDALPVTNRDYLAFMGDGGYSRPELWRPEGLRWLQRTAAEAPLFWRREGDGWVRRRFGTVEAVPLDTPVQHVCWFEADAYARWAGRRLPTEAEWEKAASWQPSGGKRAFPWGEQPPERRLANLGQRYGQPLPAGLFPAGMSPWGAAQLVGDVWEWTASDFSPYPGFRPFPYREYSEVFFGPRFKVLRGGAWGVAPVAIRTTFRNWDFPERRQIFTGFRCARDG